MTDTTIAALPQPQTAASTPSMVHGQWARAWLLLAACVVAIVVAQWLIGDRRLAWLVTTVLIAVMVMTIGWAVADRADGVLIDKRNVVSFSKFQMSVWTVLVCAAIVTEVGRRLVTEATLDPLDFSIPGELLIAMGISATSLVATPMLLSLKTPAADGSGAVVDTVFHRDLKRDASWADIFTGDETGNADSVDLGKVQQFLITLLVVGVYAFALWNCFGSPDKNTLPPISQDFAWLLGISHAGYLTYKAAPHTSASDAKNPS